MVPEGPQEQTLDFSIHLVDPGYRELLDDPDSPQYVDLAHHLQEQVRTSRRPAALTSKTSTVSHSPLSACPHRKEA